MLKPSLTRKGYWLLASLLVFVLLACSTNAAAQERADKVGDKSVMSELKPTSSPLMVGSAHAQETPEKGAVKSDEKKSQASGSKDHLLWRIFGAAFFLIVIFGGLLGYMYSLQLRFFEGCKADKQMATFFNSPAGLPVGTVRSIIALIIITVSLALIVLNAFRVGVENFPDMLTGILGTILGFYFGSRSTGTRDEAAHEQVKELAAQRDEAVSQQAATQAGTLLSEVKKGISVSKIAVEFLPEDQRKKYGDFISRMESGVKVAETLSAGGNLKEAASKAGDILGLFKSQNPVQGAFTQAVQTFGQVLGSSVPAVAVASTVVVLCAKLAGTVYQKWKARVLHGPFSPAILPLNVIDANTGFTLMQNSPVFKKAFFQELEANDRPFMGSVVELFGQVDVEKAQMDVENFWTKYHSRFDTREQFDSGLEELRRAAADSELRNDIPSDLLAEAGGYEKFTGSIDKINANPDSKAALDQLFVVTESLHKSGEPVLSILDEAKKGVQS